MDSQPNIASLRASAKVLKLIGGIDEFKGAWRAIGRIAPDRLSALRRIATIESAASSTRIEGAKLTDREVERLLSNLSIQSFATRDEQEVAGYAAAMEAVFAYWNDIALTENHIRQLHRDLLQHSPRTSGIAGLTRHFAMMWPHSMLMERRSALFSRQLLLLTRHD